MRQYRQILTNNYCIEELTYFCEKCQKKFFECVPSNYELVYFTLENGEKRFLPTYGRYGYLDLLDRLVDEWKPNDEITESISIRFITELQKITPYKVMFNEVKCPFCGNHNVLIMQRSPRFNRSIEWLEIDVDAFN